ncbi:MAG: carbon-nitrogen hydrolase family protein, partial [bacterium]|nr:carbon-nitrogen hydrolase family protein [bacterium]
MENQFVVAGVQLDVQLGDKQANLDRIQYWLEAPHTEAAQLLVFPECTLTGYCFSSRDDAMQAAEEISGGYVRQLVEMAQDFRKLLSIGMLERDQNQLYNCCLLIGANGKIVRYRKTHLPFLGGDRFVSAGDQAPPVVNLRELNSMD